jgi:hypothetical protein
MISPTKEEPVIRENEREMTSNDFSFDSNL